MSTKKTSIRVEILGESYAIRSEAAPEHTRAVAERHVHALDAGGRSGCGCRPPAHAPASAAAAAPPDRQPFNAARTLSVVTSGGSSVLSITRSASA